MGSDRLLRRQPLKPNNRSSTPYPSIFFVLAATVLAAVFSSVSASPIADPSGFHDVYTAHCKGEVFSEYPLSVTTPTANDSLSSQLRFYGVFASAAVKTDDPGDTLPRRFSFDPMTFYGTSNQDVSKVVGSLKLYSRDLSLFKNEGSRRRRMRSFHVRGPRIPVRKGRYRFVLTGYLAESIGKLCMVGSSVLVGNSSSVDVVLKVRYPVKMSINSSFVRGVLESLGDVDSKSKDSGRVSLLGFSGKMDYDYSLMEKESGKDDSFAAFDKGDDDNLSVLEPGGGGSRGWCSAFNRHFYYDMEYRGGCDAVNCNPLGKDAMFVPDHIRLLTIQCSDQGKLRLVLSFRNSSSYSASAFNPRTSLIGEGEWDPKTKRICAVACHVLNYTASLADASVGDCSIKMCMRFPATFSIINRSPLVGQIWSTKAADDSGYFAKITFQSYGYSIANQKYKYGMMGDIPDSCARKTEVPIKKAYPMASSTDMRFDIMVTNSKGQTAHGESSPLFVGVSLHQSNFNLNGYMINRNQTWLPFQTNVNGTMQNMSYSVSFSTPAKYSLGGMDLSYKVVDIFAEGVYDGATGHLCMIGCRGVVQSNTSFANSSLDCKVTIDVQFPPLKRKRGEQITGTIKSTRPTSDPLYFESLKLKSNSIYHVQATESIWRMDLEIALVVVSNTLACVFVVSQIFHVKRKPDVLPFISIVMQTVVTLGHMIPLLLNFEALFVGNHYQQSSIWRNGGWLEVKEVTVRAVTMVAFLLELRLLQLTWSARQGEANKGALWVSEKKVLYASFLLYTVGALVALLMHQWNHTVDSPVLQPGRMLRSVDMVYPVVSSHSLWEDLKSYAGLILDGFLLPQILFNLFVDSNEKALSSFFYVGTTFVRLLPHTYDLYRAHSSSWSEDFSYIYASHKMDYYSTAWNIIIPCSGMLFALLVYLQQRFSGRCILPKRFRAGMTYEKVPAVTNDDL